VCTEPVPLIEVSYRIPKSYTVSQKYNLLKSAYLKVIQSVTEIFPIGELSAQEYILRWQPKDTRPITVNFQMPFKPPARAS